MKTNWVCAALVTTAASAPLQAVFAAETVAWRFNGTAFGGSGPLGALLSSADGTLYGATSGYPSKRGKSGGTIFSLKETKTKWRLTTIYQFTGGRDGSYPEASLIGAASNALFGTTFSGGATSNQKGAFEGGTVFQLVPPMKGVSSWTETILYRFPQSDVFGPTGALIKGKGGSLFGTASSGGASGFGGVFQLLPPQAGNTAWTEKTIYSFRGGSDGAMPSAALIMDSAGSLYGTTVQGGGSNLCNGQGNTIAGCGTVFKLTPPAKGQTNWAETILYAFSGGADGSNPYSSLVVDQRGNLYGTTFQGGQCAGGNDCGVVFELSPPSGGGTSWAESLLYSFQGDAADESNPKAGLIFDPSGALYGTTFGGPGNQQQGSVFKLTPPTEGQVGWTEQTLYNFLGINNGAADGSRPAASVLLDASGNVFGTTSLGGNPSGEGGFGTVFKIEP